MLSRQAFALTLAATTLISAGCGGSSSSKPLERRQLLARGDAICRRITTKLESSSVSGVPSDANVMLPVAAYERSAAAEMRKLTPPASMASSWKQMIGGLQMLADATGELGEYARARNQQGQRSASSKALKGAKQMSTAARREGFRDCAQEL